ncbi:MAG: HEAT repeat domain-containing protein [Planctomycetota bacterium]
MIPGLLVGPPADAQTAAAPVTMWSFLGVPNPFAMNAAAQQSASPAIAAAAKAKAAKHEIPKKKKAIRYLAGIGCTPEHPEVMPALMAAMDDPDEQVRYEAVKAVLETAEICQSREQKKEVRKTKGFCGACADLKASCEKRVCEAVERLCGKAPPKEHKHQLKKAMHGLFGGECEDPAKEDCPCAERRGSCCGPEMRDKLMKLAYGRDDMGCFLEPSRRVRELAEQAFNACNACACGCEDGGDGTMDGVVREMPPEAVDREARPSEATGDTPCFEDRLLEPQRLPQPEMVPTPEPFPDAEAIPPPPAAAAMAVHRSVLVRAELPAEPTPAPVVAPANPLRLRITPTPPVSRAASRRQRAIALSGEEPTGPPVPASPLPPLPGPMPGPIPDPAPRPLPDPLPGPLPGPEDR